MKLTLLPPLLAFSCATALLAQTPSTWNGGTGFWYDAPNWSAGVPNSPAADVRVDATSGTASVVTLGYNAAVGVEYQVGRLRIEAGDRVEFGTGPSRLRLVDTAFAGAGALQIDGILALPYSSGTLSGPKTISGAGRLVLGAVGQRPEITDRTVNSAVIEGSAAVGRANASNFTVVNSGLIDANLPGQDLDFHGLGAPADWSVNTGTMRSSNGGQLLFGQGGWNNAGGTIQAEGAGSLTAFYRGGLIEGGTLQATNGGLLQVGGSFNGSNGGSTFRNLTVQGPSSILQELVADGTVTNHGTMTLAPYGRINANHYNPSYDPAVSVTLAGSGQVVLDSTDLGWSSIGYRNQRFNIQGLLIRGRGQVGDEDFNPPYIVNRGTFQADRSGSVLRLRLFGLDNEAGGILRARDGGILRIATGGILRNTGGTIEALAGGRIEANFGRIEGGLVRNFGGFVALSGMTLVNPGTGLRFEGELTLGGATFQEARLVGDIENTGTLRIAPNAGQAARIWLTESAHPSVTLRGGGQLVLGDASAPNTGPELWDGYDGAFSVRSFVNVDNTVRGFGRIGNTIYDPWLAIDNRSAIQADVSGKELSLGLYSVTNSGNFRARNGATMSLYARAGFTNTGLGQVEAEAASTVKFYSTVISGGRVVSAPGGTIEFPDGNTGRGGLILANAGTALFGATGGNRAFDGLANGGSTLINSGTIRKVGSGDYSLSTALNSTGSFAIDSGVLRNFGGGTIASNTINVATGADLTFQGPASYTFSGINTFSGGGMPAIAETTTLLADAATELRAQNFRFYWATLSGPGLLSHTGRLEFYENTGATIAGARLLTLPGATAAIQVANQPLVFNGGASWENRGLVTFERYPSPRLNGAVGTLFDNTATGILRSQTFNFGFGILDMPSRNAGRIEVTAGRMSIEKPSLWLNGSASIAQDCELHFWNPITFSGTGNTSTGAGLLFVGTANGGLVFEPGARFAADRILFYDGTDISGAGELRVSRGLEVYPFGTTTVFDAVQVQLLAGSTSQIQFYNGTFRLQNGALLRNAGTLDSRAAVYIELNSGAVLENAGLMTVTSGGNNPGFGGDNTGLFRTTADSVTRYFPSNGNFYTVGWPFEFAGQVYADSGMNLTFDRGGLLNETAKLWPNHPASSITFTGATPVRARGQANEFSGTGYVNFVGTTLQFEPSSIPGQATTIAAGARVAFHGNNVVRGGGTLSTTGFVFQNGDQTVEQNATLQTFGTADVSVWNATGRKVEFKTGARFLNGGRFVIQSQVGGAGNPGFTGQPGTLFHNQLGGTLVQDSGSVTQFNLDFRNDGELEVRAGRFEFLQGFSGTGGIAASGGGKVTLPLGTTPLNLLPGSLRTTGAGSEINVTLPNGDKQILMSVNGGSLVAAGGGNLVAAGGGNLVAAGGGNLVAAGSLNLVAAGGGNITADGGTVRVENGGNLEAAGGGNILSHNGGVLVAAGGGNIQVEGTGASLVAAGGGNVRVENGGSLVAAGGGNILSHNGGVLVAAGGGNILSHNGGVLVAAGGGNIRAEGGNLVAAGGGNLVAAGGGNLVAAGGLNRPLGVATTGGNVLAQAGGRLSGSGTFEGAGAIEADGTLAPGEELGALTWTGPLTVQTGGRLEIQLGGPVAGTQHDRINVSGAFALNGNLYVSFLNGFGAAVGPADAFDIVVSQVSASSILAGTRVPVAGTYGSFLVSIVNGGKTLRLSNYQLDPITFARWTQRYGLEGANGLPTADPFGSGLSNLMKYALGLDPSQPGGRGPSAGVFQDGLGNRYLTLSYTKPAGAETPTDLQYLPERASGLNPSDWSSASGDVIPVGDPVPGPGALQTVTVRSTRPLTGQQHEFLRLRVTLP
ncbi:MAG: hypothetical protein JSR82_11205 [Verrucomicrobia bacterium]|nr:hypothetical protein [Verrucomicrobiota bacterium]